MDCSAEPITLRTRAALKLLSAQGGIPSRACPAHGAVRKPALCLDEPNRSAADEDGLGHARDAGTRW
jgi:hypothetical protein